MNKAKLILFAFLYFSLPIGAAALVVLSEPGLCADLALCAAFFIGIAGYTWLMLQLVLSARIGFIEKGIGLDRMLVFHRIMAPVSIGLLIVHGVVKNLYYPVSVQKLSGALVYIGFAAAGVMSMILFGGGGRSCAARALRNLVFGKMNRQYQDVKLFHNLNFLLSLVLFLHVMLSSMSLYYPGLRLYFIFVFLIAAASYLYHKLLRPRLKSPLYRVSGVQRPAENITTLEFELVRGSAIANFPGQFAFFRFPDGYPGPEEHPFTISSADTLTITAKALGDFTGELSKVKVGARLRIDGPYGVFSYRSVTEDRPLVFIAGGIGITPFLSMVRGIRLEKNKRKPLLLWSVRAKSDFIYRAELEDGTELVPVLSSQDEDWDGRRGQFGYDLLKDLIPAGTLRTAAFFICGPPAMMRTVRDALRRLGVPKNHLYLERFSL